MRLKLLSPFGELDAERAMPFDVVLLGMGQMVISRRYFQICWIMQMRLTCRRRQILYAKPRATRVPRIGMNLTMLTNRHALLLLIKGEQKKALVAEVQASGGGPAALSGRDAAGTKQKAVRTLSGLTLMRIE